MRPTGAAQEAALPPCRSRKSSFVDAPRPSVTSTQPTSFFLAREEDTFRSTSRRGSASHRSEGNKQATEDQKPPPKDGSFGVQTLQDAITAAFASEAKKPLEAAEPTSNNLAGLLKRKRPNKPTSEIATTSTNNEATGSGAPAESSSKQPSPQRPTTNTPHTPLQTRVSRTNTISAPLTPLYLESPFPESAMPSTPRSGSLRSLRLSEDGDDADEADEAASQAVMQDGDEDEDRIEDDEAISGSSMVAPQLVMPSLAMPSRRPFTERGRRMSRLKIAVAGADRVGKTSLIRAIVRQCEDIVHLDPLTPQSDSTPETSRSSKKSRRPLHVTEMQASTKAYPAWWSDGEDSRILRRRKSLSEIVLERNISFIDSPGYPTSKDELDIDKLPLIAHLETLFQRNASLDALSTSELLGILSGTGGLQVDVVLYICSPAESISQHDFAYMARLSKYTTVIPIIAKSDLSPETELTRRKIAIAQELSRCNVSTNVLKPAPRESLEQDALDTAQTPMPQNEASPSSYLGQTYAEAPFLVSCLPGSDHGEMDASLLMSPSYSPPLVDSELQALTHMLFDPDTMTKLRHLSARKFLKWREKLVSSPTNQDLSLALAPTANTVLGIKEQIALVRSSPGRRTSATASSALTTRGTINSPFNLSSSSTSVAASIGTTLPDFTRARIRDHIMREERVAQIQLSKWAHELHKSVRREKEEYARLVEGERAKWLLQRVGEEAISGRLEVMDASSPSWNFGDRKRVEGGMELPSWARNRRRREDDGAVLYKNDPLGLCYMADGVARTGGIMLKALGGGVLVGAVWVAICRAWGLDERWWMGGWMEGWW